MEEDEGEEQGAGGSQKEIQRPVGQQGNRGHSTSQTSQQVLKERTWGEGDNVLIRSSSNNNTGTPA